jgi:hypothetical protein
VIDFYDDGDEPLSSISTEFLELNKPATDKGPVSVSYEIDMASNSMYTFCHILVNI